MLSSAKSPRALGLLWLGSTGWPIPQTHEHSTDRIDPQARAVSSPVPPPRFHNRLTGRGLAQWRGPERNGISAESDWSGAWPAGGPAVAWKASLGVGFSSFVVAGGRAYCTGNSNNTDTLFCFDAADGRLVWQHSWASDWATSISRAARPAPRRLRAGAFTC